MLKSNKLNLIIALITAIVLWAYVLVDVNQSSTETVRGVPITLVNEQTLAADDLVILSMDYSKVNINYSCQRQALSKIKDADFTVTADVEGLKAGENKVKLNVNHPDDVSIENLSVQKITIVVDELVSAEKPINPTLENQTDDESEPSIVQISDEKVTVKGAKTLVEKVTSVRAALDAGKVTDKMKSLTVSLVPVDENGEEVEGVKLSKSNVSITAVMLKKKTVSLDVPIRGVEHSAFERSYAVPKTITIKGREDLLSSIESISCREINLSNIYEDTKIKIEPILPSGVTAASESQNLYVNVSVKGVETKTFTFTENDVVLSGIGEDATAVVKNVKIKVTVTAKPEEMSDITEEDFSLTADIDGLEEGEHTVGLSCVCTKSHTDLEYTPGEINISITME